MLLRVVVVYSFVLPNNNMPSQPEMLSRVKLFFLFPCLPHPFNSTPCISVKFIFAILTGALNGGVSHLGYFRSFLIGRFGPALLPSGSRSARILYLLLHCGLLVTHTLLAL